MGSSPTPGADYAPLIVQVRALGSCDHQAGNTSNFGFTAKRTHVRPWAVIAVADDLLRRDPATRSLPVKGWGRCASGL